MNTASDNLLEWDNAKSWLNELEWLVPEICNEYISNKVRENGYERIVNDNLNWLQPLLHGNFSDTDNLPLDIINILRGYFTHIKAYHGCRPTNIGSYLEIGIIPLNKKRAMLDLKRKVCSGAMPLLTEEALIIASESVDIEDREGRVYFECNKKFLLGCCGHYLLYGSEYGVCVLRQIVKNFDYAQLLKNHGIPTLLTCKVPIYLLQQIIQEELAISLISTYFQNRICPDGEYPAIGESFGFEIYSSLPPAFIINIEYPEKIRDPIAYS